VRKNADAARVGSQSHSANKRCWSSTAWPLRRLTAATRSEDLMARMLDFAEAGVLAQGHASKDRLEEGRR